MRTEAVAGSYRVPLFGLLALVIQLMNIPAVHGSDIAQHESALLDEIRAQYRAASLNYEKKDYAVAEKGFFDCISLYQASAKYLSNVEQLETIRLGCERHMKLASAARKRDSAISGLERQLSRLELPGLHFREVEAGVALETLRRRIGELLRTEPPPFIVQMPAEAMNRRITLELEHAPALYAVQQIAERAGAEIRFERHAVVFSPRQTISNAPLQTELAELAAAAATTAKPQEIVVARAGRGAD